MSSRVARPADTDAASAQSADAAQAPDTAQVQDAALARGAAQDSPGPGALWARPWGVVALWALGAIIAFGCYLRLAQTRAANSDAASQALQAWDMLHGNLLLHGWGLSDV